MYSNVDGEPPSSPHHYYPTSGAQDQGRPQDPHDFRPPPQHQPGVDESAQHGGDPSPHVEGKAPKLIHSSRGGEGLLMKDMSGRGLSDPAGGGRSGSPKHGGGVSSQGGGVGDTPGESGSVRRVLSRSMSGPHEEGADPTKSSHSRRSHHHHHHHHHHHQDRPSKAIIRQDSGSQGAPEDTPPTSHHHPHFHHHRSSRHSQGKDHTHASPQWSPRSMSVSDSTAEEGRREPPRHHLTKSSYSLDPPSGNAQSTPTLPYQNTQPYQGSSTPVKRNVAVTDLDQAMQERDESRLRTLFGDSMAPGQANVSFGYTPGFASQFHGGEVDETNLDDDPVNMKYITSAHSLQPGQSFGSSDYNNGAGGEEERFLDCREMDEEPQKCGHSSNTDESVRYPMDMPPSLHFNQSDVFDGQLLLQWLSSQFDSSHYLTLILTKQDVAVLMSQFCTHLLAAGVLSQLQGQNTLREPSFKNLFPPSPMVSTTGPSRTRHWANQSCLAVCSPCGRPATKRPTSTTARDSSTRKQNIKRPWC